MLRASIRFAVKKYNIEDGLEKLENPNHHKMMRNELTMNIFPFGDDGADNSIIIKLARKFFIMFTLFFFLNSGTNRKPFK